MWAMYSSHLLSQLADQHLNDLRRDVAGHRVTGVERRMHPPSRVRRRAGLALITVGLRLAVGRPAGAL
jgi:hypothetical protein